MKYEVELKCLIGDKELAEALPEKIRKLGYSVELQKELTQLNDYFINGDLPALARQLRRHLGTAEADTLQDIVKNYASFTVRARQNNDRVLFILKAVPAGQSANHATQRVEFEEPVNLNFEELNNLITSCGFEIEARWQAYRKIYRISNGVTLDNFFTPGYGYVAELEKVVDGDESAAEATEELKTFMKQLGLEELDKHRLERMFAFYNENWRDYYGTDRVFTVE